jgi:RNA polymerase sigma factor (sigma-70 family)
MAKPTNHADSSINSFNEYLAMIQSIPKLSLEEEQELVKNGEKQKLVYHHLKVIPGMVKRYLNDSVTFEDLIQQGNLGLAQAAEKYNLASANGARFMTYATFYVDKLAREYITDNRHVIRFRMNTAFRKLMFNWKHIGIIPPLTGEEKKDVAQALSVKIEDVERFTSWRYTPYLTIFSGASDSANQISEEDITDEDLDILAWLVNQDIDTLLSNAIAKLPPRFSRILQDRTFMPKGEGKRLERLSRDLNVSVERVRQLEVIAIEKLREVLGEKVINELKFA